MEKISFETVAFLADTQRSFVVDILKTKPQWIECYTEKEHLDKLCKLGCVNYKQKWSCPPYSPSFFDFTGSWEQLFILYLRTDMEQYSYIKNDYLKIKAANVILKSRADRFLRKMAGKYGEYISTGSCRLCRPCRCKSGLPCARPEIMAYSFEALGVNVDQLVDKFFPKPLLWYKPHCLPEYTSVVCGLLTNAEVTVEFLKTEFLSYTSK